MLFSARSIVKLAGPMLLQSIFNTTIALVDSLMVASLGEAAVSGVSLIGSLDAMLSTFFMALTVGGTVILSQYLGKNEDERAREAAKQMLYVVSAMALLIGVLGVIFRRPMLNLLFGDVEAAVMKNAQDYFFYMVMSYPLLGISESCAASFRAVGDSATPMAGALGSNIVNVGANALFIYGVGLGVSGAAIASLISRALAAAVFVVLLHRRNHRIYLERLLHYRPNIDIIRDILRIGVPHALGNCMFHIGKLLTQSVVSTLGTMSITANSVGLNIANYQYMISNTIGSTAMIVIGRCIGAGEKKQAKTYATWMMLAAYVGIWLMTGITVLFVRPIIGAWQLEEATLELTRRLLLFHSASAAAIYPLAFVLPSIFRAASDVKITTVVSVVSMWTFRVALCYLFVVGRVSVFGVEPGIMSVWMAMVADWICRATVFTVRYLSGKWLLVYDQIQAKKKVEA